MVSHVVGQLVSKLTDGLVLLLVFEKVELLVASMVFEKVDKKGYARELKMAAKMEILMDTYTAALKGKNAVVNLVRKLEKYLAVRLEYAVAAP